MHEPDRDRRGILLYELVDLICCMSSGLGLEIRHDDYVAILERSSFQYWVRVADRIAIEKPLPHRNSAKRIVFLRCNVLQHYDRSLISRVIRARHSNYLSRLSRFDPSPSSPL